MMILQRGHRHSYYWDLFWLVTFITCNILLNSLTNLVCYPYPLLLERKFHECRAFCLFLLLLSTQGRWEDLDRIQWVFDKSLQNKRVSQLDRRKPWVLYTWLLGILGKERFRIQIQAYWNSDPLTFAFPKGCEFELKKKKKRVPLKKMHKA